MLGEEILHLRKSRKKKKCGSEIRQVAGGHIRRFPWLRHALEVPIREGKKGTGSVKWGRGIAVGYVPGGVEESV